MKKIQQTAFFVFCKIASVLSNTTGRNQLTCGFPQCKYPTQSILGTLTQQVSCVPSVTPQASCSLGFQTSSY